MGKISLPVSEPLPTPHDAEVFTIDKDAILENVAGSIPLTSKEEHLSDEAVEMMQVKRSVGLDALDDSYNEEIKGILEIGKEAGLTDKALLDKIRVIKYKLGNVSDTSLAKQVYHYMKLDTQIKSLVSKQRMMEYAK